MPRRRDRFHPRRRKHVRHPRRVLVAHVARLSPANKQHRPREPISTFASRQALAQRIRLHLRQRRREHRQINRPAPPAILPALQICRQKFPHRPIRHPPLHLQLRLPARLQLRQPQLVHRRKFRPMPVREISLRRDVHHHQPPHPIRMPASQQHRHLPPHAVPHQIHRAQPARVQPRQHIRHHRLIGHHRVPRRFPMIP